MALMPPAQSTPVCFLSHRPSVPTCVLPSRNPDTTTRSDVGHTHPCTRQVLYTGEGPSSLLTSMFSQDVPDLQKIHGFVGTILGFTIGASYISVTGEGGGQYPRRGAAAGAAAGEGRGLRVADWGHTLRLVERLRM